MRLASWNVNGLRAVAGRDGLAWAFGKEGHAGEAAVDVVCLQETKIQPDAITAALRSPPGWSRSFWSHHATKKGYSGTAVFVRDGLQAEPFAFSVGADRGQGAHPEYDAEGRVCAVDLDDFVLLNGYFPNGGSSDERLRFKHAWHDAFLEAVVELQKTRAVVVCGDLNVAHRPIDLAFPDRWGRYTGFLPEERAWFDRLLAAGFLDSFREEKGELPRQFTFWETRVEARKDNTGWRIDYFVVDKALEEQLIDAWISPQIFGSDHCPIGVELLTRNTAPLPPGDWQQGNADENVAVDEDVVDDEEADDDGPKWRR